MDFRTEPAGVYARALALISLFMGLGDAARLLGIDAGPASPIASLGPAGFVILAILCLSRLFAALGLWMQVRWGAILFAGALGVELVLYLFFSDLVVTSFHGFIFKLVAMLATISLLALAHFLSHRHVSD